MPWEDQLPGGLADDKSPADFDPEAVLKGIKVELEHTDDRRIATEITLDHLSEDPDYYDKLATIEDHGDSEADVVVPEVKLSEPRTRVFVEGDEFYAEVGSVADALFERGAKRLGAEALRWLSEATAATRAQRWERLRTQQLNPYRARR